MFKNPPASQLKQCVICDRDFAARGPKKTCSDKCSLQRKLELHRLYSKKLYASEPVKMRAKAKLSYARNRDKISQQIRVRRNRDPEQFRAIERANYYRNRDKWIARASAHYDQNKNDINARRKQYRAMSRVALELLKEILGGSIPPLSAGDSNATI